MGIVAAAFVAEHAQLINQLDEVLEPSVFRYRAREILQHLGHEPPAGSSAVASGFDNEDMHFHEVHRWKTNDKPIPDLRLGFWYREAAEEFHSESMGYRMGIDGPARVCHLFPDWNKPAMRGVRMDATGELNWFRAVPDLRRKRDDPPTDVAPWSEWFPAEYTGYDLQTLEQTDQGNIPLGSFDASKSWVAKAPGGETVTITAAAFRGDPVYFEVVAKGQPRIGRYVRFNEQKGFLVIIMMTVVTTVVSVVLAIRNFLFRKWDRQGAWRLVVFLLIVQFVGNIAAAHHVSSLWEMAVASVCFAAAAVWCAQLWVFYIAFEPLVRRSWPSLLISWTRVLDGRFADPIVGRDILFGTCIGAAYAVLADAGFCFRSAGYPRMMSPDMLSNYAAALSKCTAMISGSTFLVLMSVVILVVLRPIVRSVLVAAAIFVILVSSFHAGAYSYPKPFFPVLLIANGLMMFVLIRYGLVAALFAAFAEAALRAPISMDPSDFWFGHGLLSISLVLAITIYGMITATGRRFNRLFGAGVT